jgi:hypothetical protein
MPENHINNASKTRSQRIDTVHVSKSRHPREGGDPGLHRDISMGSSPARDRVVMMQTIARHRSCKGLAIRRIAKSLS